MSEGLAAFVARQSDAAVDPRVAALAGRLAREAGAEAVLFYGSNLRTGALDGVLDFYVLMPGARERGMWPRVGYREAEVDGVALRAKIATMRTATFARAAADRSFDTTIWTRFVQPSALIWVRDEEAAQAVRHALADCAVTAARYAAALGPARGADGTFWHALFRATYAAELRVERAGRHEQFVARDAGYYAALLPLAWAAGGIDVAHDHGTLAPAIGAPTRGRLLRRWRRRQAMGKPINVARLVRAAFTFDGAARYGAWKIERHTGVAVALTPWRERHPVLAAPGVLWRVWRARAQ